MNNRRNSWIYKILGTFMVFVLILNIAIPKSVKAKEITLPNQIYVGNDALFNYSEQMWRTVGSGWKYDMKTNTLYLHGSINTNYNNGSTKVFGCVYVDGSVNIVVDGPTIINHEAGYMAIYVNGNCNMTIKNNLTIKCGAGIVTSGSLKMTGKGKTNINAKGNLFGCICANGYFDSTGTKVAKKSNLIISDMKNLKMSTPTMYAMRNNGGNITIKNSTITAKGYVGGIAAFFGNIKITGKKNNITASAKSSKGSAISVVTKCFNSYIGCQQASGKGKIKLGKGVKVSSPSGAKVKKATLDSPITTNTKAKIKVTLKTYKKNGNVQKKVVIK